MVFVNLRLRGRGLLPDTMTWTPEPQYPFFRLTETPQSMPWLAPEGKTLITADIGAEIGDEHWTMDDAELGELCIDGARPSSCPTARRDYLGCRVLRARRSRTRCSASSTRPTGSASRPPTGVDRPGEHRPQRRVRAHPHGGRVLADRPARPPARAELHAAPPIAA